MIKLKIIRLEIKKDQFWHFGTFFDLKTLLLLKKIRINETELWKFQPFNPNCPRPRFCLFVKFGQAIVIRVLMRNL